MASSTPTPAQDRSDTPAGPAVSSLFLASLYQETEGNPFFVEEVLQHLVEEGAIARREGRWEIQPPPELQVPPSVQAAIGRRLERLSAESREALTLAAVIGLQFDFEVLLQASGVEEERLVGWVEEWLGARLVFEEPLRTATACPPPGGQRERERYQFQHALIREVLYGGVSRQRQGRLHERAGLALEAVPSREEPLEELAHHFARARSETAREKGVEYCLRAGGLAHDLSAPTAAIHRLEGALRLLELLARGRGAPETALGGDLVAVASPRSPGGRGEEPPDAGGVPGAGGAGRLCLGSCRRALSPGRTVLPGDRARPAAPGNEHGRL